MCIIFIVMLNTKWPCSAVLVSLTDPCISLSVFNSSQPCRSFTFSLLAFHLPPLNALSHAALYFVGIFCSQRKVEGAFASKLSLNTPLTRATMNHLTHPLRYSKPWVHTRMFPLESIFNRLPYVVSYTRPLERRGERERTFERTRVWEYSDKWIIDSKIWPS